MKEGRGGWEKILSLERVPRVFEEERYPFENKSLMTK